MQYIYSLKDPVTCIPFYVGYTNRTERRFKEHVKVAQKNEGHNVRRNEKLKALVEAGYGYSDILSIHSTVADVRTAKKVEIATIKLFGRMDLNEGPLFNMTDGGDGNACPGERNGMFGKESPFKGKTHTAEAKEKLSQAKKQHWSNRTHSEFFGEEKSKEILEKLHASRLGSKHSDATKEKIGKANAMKVRTEEQRQKLSASLLENPTHAKSYKLVSPDGIEYFTVKGLTALCRDLGLSKNQCKALQALIRKGRHSSIHKDHIVYGWSIFYA